MSERARDAGRSDCERPCGASACCAATEACGEDGQCRCAPRCNGRVCGPDGCGGSCGSCGARAKCVLRTGQCGPDCIETDAELCRRFGAQCEPIEVTDLCGDLRNVDCGTCPSPTTCGGGNPGAPHQCDCTRETNAEFCSRLGKDCGEVSGHDNCDRLRVVDCGECTAPGATCGDARHSVENVCVCYPESDDEFCQRTRVCNGHPELDNCGALRTVSACGCTEPDRCSRAGFCGSANNDICLYAEPLHVDPVRNVAVATGDLSIAKDDTVGSCGGGGGGDLVYELFLVDWTALEVSVTPSATMPFRPVVYLRSGCEDAASEQACVVVPAGQVCSADGAAVIRTGSAVPPGYHYVWVDGASAADAGEFTLKVKLSVPAFDPTIDRCATVLDVHESTRVDIVDDTAQVLAQSARTITSCGWMEGPELWYAMTFATRSIVEAKVVMDACSAVQPGLYITGRCGPWPAPEYACAMGANGVATLRSPPLPVGQLMYLAVDTVAQYQVGTFDLTVEIGEVPSNDTCARPMAFYVDPDPQVISGGPVDTRWAVDDLTGSCGAMSGSDLVYRVNVPADMGFAATLSPTTGSALFPALHLRGDCADAASESACAVAMGGVATISLPPPPACTGQRNLYLVVDGTADSRGAADLYLTGVSASPTTTSCCGSATPVTLGASGTASVTGDTTASGNHFGDDCASAGNDLVYSVVLGATQTALSATVVPAAGSTAKHSVYIRHACAGTEYVCAESHAAGRQVSMSALGLTPGGTYYVFVDGATASDNGAFTLNLAAN